MAAVVDHDVEWPELVDDRAEEVVVALITHSDMAVHSVEGRCTRVLVESDDRGPRSEVLALEVERPAVRDPDLQERRRLPLEPPEVGLIDREVVRPLVEERPCVARKLLPESWIDHEAMEQPTDSV